MRTSPSSSTPRYRQLMFMAVALVTSLTAVAQQRPAVELAQVERSAVYEEVELNGTVTPLKRAELSTAVSGLVESLAVDVGDRVSAGSRLLTLDSEQTRFEYEGSEAALAEARIRLQEAERQLAEAKSVGVGRNIAATEVSRRESEVAAARAAFARARAEERRLAVVLQRHELKAPFDGIVSHRFTDLGEWVNPGSPLLTLVNVDELVIDFAVPQEVKARVTTATELQINRATEAGKPLTANIKAIVPISDAATRTFRIRAEVPPNSAMAPGTAVSGTLRIQEEEQGLVIPRDAVNRYPEGRVTAWVATEVGEGQYQVSEQRIRLGAGFGSNVAVLDGLTAGQQVVVRGNEGLNEGATVRLATRSAR